MITIDSKRTAILAISLAVLMLTQTPRVQAWAWDTHRFIDNKAEDVFSDNSFFSNYYSTLNEWCIKPDQGWGERDWHWLDAISYHPLETTGGKLPWAVENLFDDIVQNLKDENWGEAAQLMGAVSHFTADATMPLHATFDYDPGGNHVSYEFEVDHRVDRIPIPEYVPQELDNIFDAAMATLEESFDFTDEDPGEGVNLSDFLENDILWNDTIRVITENRLRAAVQFTANLWYTAMIRAGLTVEAPTLEEPANGTLVATSKPTLTWSSVNGTDFYDLQLALDNEFTSDVIIKDLSNPSYTLENPLAGGDWCWRIRSGDNSTHVGLWSQTQWFTVKTEEGPPITTIIVIVVLIILGAVFYRRWRAGHF